MRVAVGLDRGGGPEDPTVDGELKVVANRIRNRVLGDPGRLADEDVDRHRLAIVSACFAWKLIDDLAGGFCRFPPLARRRRGAASAGATSRQSPDSGEGPRAY